LVWDGGLSRAYGDTLTELCAMLIPEYASTPDEPTRFRLRYRLTKTVQTQAQAVLVAGLPEEVAASTPDERRILGSGDPSATAITRWGAPVPLVLITIEYAPITTVPRPISRPRGEEAPNDPDATLFWLDPTTERSLLRSLDALGAITIGEARPPDPSDGAA
jgi:hypothetical protein